MNLLELKQNLITILKQKLEHQTTIAKYRPFLEQGLDMMEDLAYRQAVVNLDVLVQYELKVENLIAAWHFNNPK